MRSRDVALDEGDAAFGRFAIDRAPRLHVERLDVSRRFARPAFPDERGIRLLVALRDRGVRFVAGAWDAPELVEALVGGLAASFRAIAAEVPLAEERGRVAGRLQRLGDGDLPQRDAARLRGAGSNRVASGHQRRARHRAGELDVEVVEADAFSGELVEARRDVAAHAAIGADLAPAEVVGKDQDDVGALLGESRLPPAARRRPTRPAPASAALPRLASSTSITLVDGRVEGSRTRGAAGPEFKSRAAGLRHYDEVSGCKLTGDAWQPSDAARRPTARRAPWIACGTISGWRSARCAARRRLRSRRSRPWR